MKVGSTVKVPFCLPEVTEADKKSVMDALSSQWLTGGTRTLEFERMVAQYVGVKHAISTSSCTTALHLIIRALNIGHGDEVIVPVLTFVATANATIFCGAKPVFADIDEQTFNISPVSILEKITSRTKAIIVVHYAGQACEMDEIMRIAKKRNLYLVEDCAHSLGANYKGKETGSFGIAGAFSFYPTKPITTGEGGVVTTDDDALANQIRLMRSHGMSREALERERYSSWYYDVTTLGYNYRMSDINAALGISQLKRLRSMNRRRAEIASYYTKRLAEIEGIVTPYQASDRVNSNHIYVVRVTKKFGMNRDELFKQLSQNGIGLSVHYTPLHLFAYYMKTFGYRRGDFPVVEKVYGELLSLPLFPTLKREQIDYVVERIKACQLK